MTSKTEPRCLDEDELMRDELGDLTVNQRARIEAHVVGCVTCAARQSRVRQFLGQVSAAARHTDGRDDGAFTGRVLAAVQALPQAAGAGVAPAAGRSLLIARGPWLALAAAILLVPGVIGLRARLRPAQPAAVEGAGDARGAAELPGTFTARGGARAPVAAAEVLLLRQAQLAPVGARAVGPGDRFAVRVSNPGPGVRYLLAFAIDARGEVHWLYPAYTDAGSDPAAHAVAPATGDRLLGDLFEPEAPAAGRFELATVLASAPLHVKEVEAKLAQRSPGAALAALFPGATVHTVTTRWQVRR